ncbi:hypothetical protein P261_02581 [Lachnospiraceae bacterium TWA4]|nr:hypothetical protein P261_02581 [Lachnospiraceae bacterium TWA4]
MNQTFKQAFVKSLPIFFSYVFVAFSYGLMMEEKGYSWIYSLFTSLTVYTGAFQFVLITFLSSGASVATIAVTAFFMNSRQTFYSITFLEDFKEMKQKWYMVHTMTDETYAVNCTFSKNEPDCKEQMFLVALFSRCYWMLGAVLGGILGQIIPVELEGIDFCMTALFVIIFIDQWEKASDHRFALIGLGVGVISLLIFGKSAFILPALLITAGILLFMGHTKDENVEEVVIND